MACADYDPAVSNPTTFATKPTTSDDQKAWLEEFATNVEKDTCVAANCATECKEWTDLFTETCTQCMGANCEGKQPTKCITCVYNKLLSDAKDGTVTADSAFDDFYKCTKSEGLSIGVLIGIIAGAVVGVILIGLGIYFGIKKGWFKKKEATVYQSTNVYRST